MNNILKLAIQKKGRLANDTLLFLRRCGLEFESYKTQLFSNCRNFPLQILYVRDDDIADYVESGTVDLGIIGQNILYEDRPRVKKLLNLRYGFCNLVIAIPKQAKIKTLKDLQGKTIATSYPNSVKKFLKNNKVKTQLIKISGSVEVTPALGIASAIADLTSTGSTLVLNDLKILTKIYQSEAVFIANKKSLLAKEKKDLIKKLSLRFQGVLSADKYKYVIMNAPCEILPKVKKIIPGLKSPPVSPLAKTGWISVSSVVKEDIFWETIERLKRAGASGILVLPIEKMIN